MKETTVRIINAEELMGLFEVYFGEEYEDVEFMITETEEGNLIVEEVRLFKE